MTEFPRLADDAGGPGAGLLRAARDDAPPSDVLARTLLAVGAGAAATGIGTAAAAKTAKAGMSVFAKYVLIGFASGVVAVGGGAVAHHVVSAPAPAERREAPVQHTVAEPKPALENAPAPPAEEPAMAPLPEPKESAAMPAPRMTGIAPGRGAPTVAEAQPGAVPAPSSVDPAPRDAAMEIEVRLLDEVRAHVAASRGREALDALGRYSREVKQPRLAPEAWYLQMEAHAVRNDRAAAVRAAQALLQRYPNGPHALRARKILEGP